MTATLRRAAVLPLLALALFGCAGAQPPRPDHDPIEGVNRQIFWFNDQVDTWVLEPAARVWDHAWPDPVQRGLSNFFDNLRFPLVLVNDLLQARPRQAVETVARFQCNTFLGGLGFFDLASDLGVPPHVQDTGLTFGRWGIPPGPFLMLPLLGPSNPRDLVGLVGDALLAIYPYFVTVPGLTVGLGAIDIVNRRSRILGPVQDAKAASLDYYSFVRNAYVQRRWREIHGQPPTAEQQEELYNDEIYEDYLEEGE
ncbi:MAG: VacJ family lipoprotein [Candidatus Binatia bacterium]